MSDIERLRKLQNSKKASMSVPLAVRVLEEHNERLLRLEALVLENDHADVVYEEQVVPEEEDVITMQPEQEPEQEPEPDNGAYLDELLQKLLEIQDEASLLEDELTSIKKAEEEPIEEDLVSECTEACVELLSSEGVSSNLSKVECKSCIKTRAKMHKKEMKMKDKERAKEVKRIKLKQRELLIQEQYEVAQRLKNLKSGRSELFGMIDTGQIEILVSEIDQLAGELAISDQIL